MRKFPFFSSRSVISGGDFHDNNIILLPERVKEDQYLEKHGQIRRDMNLLIPLVLTSIFFGFFLIAVGKLIRNRLRKDKVNFILSYYFI